MPFGWRSALPSPRQLIVCRSSSWVLLDFGSVIVHVFAPEEREYYGLERLWSNAPQVVRVV